MQIKLTNGETARTIIRSIGKFDYRMYVRGDASHSALGSSWAKRGISLDISEKETNPNDAEEPDWYFPLHSVGTWSVAPERSSTRAKFILAMSLNWPANFGLRFDDAAVRVKYKEDGKSSVTVASAELYGSSKTFQVHANKTDQKHELSLSVQSDSVNGKQYCMSGRTIINDAACAIGAMAAKLIGRETMSMGVEASYTLLPSVIQDLGLPASHPRNVVIKFDMQLFHDYWSDTYRRVKSRVKSENKFCANPKDPIKWLDFGNYVKNLAQGKVKFNINMKLRNPFSFDMGIKKVQVLVAYDDIDGADVLLGERGPQTMKTNPTTFGNTVATANHAQILNLKAGTEDWLTNIHVSPGSGVVGHGIRLYDEIVNKNRMCMHIIEGSWMLKSAT